MPDAPPRAPENSDVRIQQPANSLRQEQQPLPPPKALKGRVQREDRPTDEILGALAADKSVSGSEASSALDWFLAEEPDEDAELTHTVELNVGLGDKEQWISWIVRPIDADELRRIQRSTSAMRRRNRADDLAVDQIGNLRIVIAGSVDPDIAEIAREQGKQPEAILAKRFRTKPGLITLLSSQIMSLSGFDDEDVRDAISAKN